ncbi:hypothetical protein Hanom_Chr17g01547541 [Helianthus anomalus]
MLFDLSLFRSTISICFCSIYMSVPIAFFHNTIYLCLKLSIKLLIKLSIMVLFLCLIL